MDDGESQGASNHDPHPESQKIKKARGGLSYDLRPHQYGRRSVVQTTVFRSVDDDFPGRTPRRSVPPRNSSSFPSKSANTGRNQTDNEVDSPRLEEHSMPHLHRRDSEASRFASSRSSPLMIAVDEWHEMNAAKEKEQEVDEPHISEDLRPSFSEGEYRKADRPRTQELNNFGVVSSLTGREKDCRDFSREATHFSDNGVQSTESKVRSPSGESKYGG